MVIVPNKIATNASITIERGRRSGVAFIACDFLAQEALPILPLAIFNAVRYVKFCSLRLDINQAANEGLAQLTRYGVRISGRDILMEDAFH